MWRDALSSRWCAPFAVVVGMLLIAPAINIGLVADDYIHWSILTGRAPGGYQGSLWGLFTFFDGHPYSNQALKDSGRLIWWGSDLLRLSFWRPLAEITHWVDYQLWPQSVTLMHVHNLAWYSLLIYMVNRLYRQLDPDVRRANLATLLFAGNYLHVFAVAWLASRNQMITGVCMSLSLMAFHAWRSRREPAQAWYAGIALMLALLGSEGGIATLGYMAAYLLTFEQNGTWRSRAKAILPFLLVAAVWKVVHTHMGYGSAASPAYIDPATDFPRFVQSLMLRLPALMGAQWFGFSTGVFEQLPMASKQLYAAGMFSLLALMGWLFYKVKGFEAPLARFLILGSVLVLVPACATLSMDRLVLNANIGMCGFLAVLIQRVLADRETLRRGWAWAGKHTVYLMLGVHLVLFPAAMLLSSSVMKTMLWPTTVGEPLSLPDAEKIQAPHVILVNPPTPEMVYYYPLARAFYGVSNPTSMQVLGTGGAPSTLSRRDEDTLVLDVPEGIAATMARDTRAQPFRAGDTAQMGGIQVEVLAVTPDRLPRTVAFHFPSSLSDPAWRFYAWKDTSYVAIEPPAVGHSVAFPRIDLMKLVSERLKRTG